MLSPDGTETSVSTLGQASSGATYTWTWAKTYNEYKQVTSETDPLGRTTTNVYGPLNGLHYTSTDPLGQTTSHSYAVNGDRLSTTDPLDHTTQYEYDVKGRLTKQTDALGRETTFTYDINGNKLSETATRTHLGSTQTMVTTYVYDKNDRVTSTTYPDGATTQTVYSASGKMVDRIDELGRVTHTSYDDLDQQVSTTFADGTSTSTTYDDEGHAVTQTDQLGRVTTTTFDELGRSSSTVFADGATSSRTYDAAGRLSTQTNAAGHTTVFVYDAAGRRTQSIDALGHASVTTYDAAGRTVSQADALGHATTSTYDAGGRLTDTTFADGTVQHRGYDAGGRMVSQTDELGRVTTRGYDALGRLTSVTDALGHTTSYGYDEVGHMVSQTDANGHVTTFAFDARGRQVSRTLPDGASESKTYDAAGNVATRTDFAGRVTTYSYDTMGRLVGRAYPDGSSVSFAYAATGRRASFTDARGTTSYGYDVRDRVTSLTYPDGRSLSYTYDAEGHRASLTAHVGADSLSTQYGYDAADRPSQVTDPLGRVFSMSYDDAGRMTAMSYPNATTTSYSHDVRNRLASIATLGPGNALVQSYSLTVDAAGRRTAIAEGDGTSRSYGYDDVDRLVTETVSGGPGPQYAKTFGYDPVGNRLQQTTTGDGAASVAYSYDSRDRLVSEGATAYASDANGNVINKAGSATYVWDFENRLTRVELADGSKVEHDYDVAGNRVRTTVTPAGGAAEATDYLVDTTGGLSHVVADSSAGDLVALYVRLGDRLLVAVRPASGGGWQSRFVHHDAIGSVRALTDEAAMVAAVRGYEAFGTRNYVSGSDELAYGYAGEALEERSGLAYHRARWMDARSGRFISSDPLTTCLDCSDRPRRFYSYAQNNPAMYADGSGEDLLQTGAALLGMSFLATMASGCVRTGLTGSGAGLELSDVRDSPAWLRMQDAIMHTEVHGDLLDEQTGIFNFHPAGALIFSGAAITMVRKFRIGEKNGFAKITGKFPAYGESLGGPLGKTHVFSEIEVSPYVVAGCNAGDPDYCRGFAQVVLAELEHTFAERNYVASANGIEVDQFPASLYPMKSEDALGINTILVQAVKIGGFGPIIGLHTKK